MNDVYWCEAYNKVLVWKKKSKVKNNVKQKIHLWNTLACPRDDFPIEAVVMEADNDATDDEGKLDLTMAFAKWVIFPSFTLTLVTVEEDCCFWIAKAAVVNEGETRIRLDVRFASLCNWLSALAFSIASFAALCSFSRSSKDLHRPVTARLRESACVYIK